MKRPKRESLAGWLWMSVELVVSSSIIRRMIVVSEVPYMCVVTIMVRFDNLNT